MKISHSGAVTVGNFTIKVSCEKCSINLLACYHRSLSYRDVPLCAELLSRHIMEELICAGLGLHHTGMHLCVCMTLWSWDSNRSANGRYSIPLIRTNFVLEDNLKRLPGFVLEHCYQACQRAGKPIVTQGRD